MIKSLLFLALAMPALQAGIITNLFPTGVDDSFNSIANALIDPHYVVMVSGTPQAVVVGGPPTYVQSPPAKWVWQTWQQLPTNVTLTFRTTFLLSSFQAGSPIISGFWATDNLGLDILINGQSTGNTCGGFASLCAFTINSGFVDGVNTIDFVVQDTGIIGGLLVSSLTGTFAPIPEPATVLLCGLGLVALGVYKRRA